MNVLVLAPHQDDEILGAGGLIQICKERGDSVRVVFATNGDHRGSDIAFRRYHESREALSRIGVPESEIYYLGYGDTGMRACHSFLLRLLHAPMDQALDTPVSSTTYHPTGRGGRPFDEKRVSLRFDLVRKKNYPRLARIPRPLRRARGSQGARKDSGDLLRQLCHPDAYVIFDPWRG